MPESAEPKKKLTGRLNPFRMNQSKLVSFEYIARISTIIIGLLTVYLTIFAILQRSWQSIILAAVFALITVAIIWITTKFSRIESPDGLIVLSIVIGVSLIIISGFIKNIWIPAAITNLVLTFLVASIVARFPRPGRWIDLIFPIGLVISVACALLGILAPLAQIENTVTLITMYVLMVGLLAIFIFLMLTNRIQAGLRIKLTSIFLGIALVPLVSITVIESMFLQNAIQSEANTALYLAASQVKSNIDSFIQSNLKSVSQQASLDVFINYIEAVSAGRGESSTAKQELATTIHTLRSGLAPYTPAFSIVDADGKVIYDTNPLTVTQSEINADYFLQPKLTGKAYASSVEFLPESGNPYIYFTAPIKNARGEFAGILKVRYDALILQKTIQTSAGILGPSSFPILLDDNQIRLADTITPNLLYKAVSPLTSSIETTLVNQNRLPSNSTMNSTNLVDFANALHNSGTAPYFTANIYPGQTGNLQAGAIVQLDTQPWKVVFVESQNTILAVRDQQLRVSTLIATGIAALVGILGTVVSTVISNPITHLTTTAEAVATGNLEARAEVRTHDEIENLATAFNMMTSQLKGFISELESRVNERTKQLAEQNISLQTRSRQLQTVADVARSITEAQDIETLLNRIVTLVSERFGFYHAGVFLVDEQKKFAVLRAANSEGGKRMLARHHQLEIGQVGIVGYVTSQGNQGLQQMSVRM